MTYFGKYTCQSTAPAGLDHQNDPGKAQIRTQYVRMFELTIRTTSKLTTGTNLELTPRAEQDLTTEVTSQLTPGFKAVLHFEASS